VVYVLCSHATHVARRGGDRIPRTGRPRREGRRARPGSRSPGATLALFFAWSRSFAGSLETFDVLFNRRPWHKQRFSSYPAHEFIELNFATPKC